ncbi:universal stress protein [Blastococcus sp. CCUG 61487]|uniref:universal stress protein n=1 Tax=Blastococcus sp. CCUG 61487 TaxID=1840703 RepID=UPI0010C11B3C|nr:universal stress protein [Blastococcus sp. CCUG 61487]TKJ18119.1 hypothetical protein A6V29_12330 [Blastococcus sp. CCUG 61487]
MSWELGLLLGVLWVVIGVLAVLVLLHRRGHADTIWYLLGAVLGPLMVPIAYERGRSRSVVLEREDAPGTWGDGAVQLRVLVGVDGSPESDQAVRDAARLLGTAGARLVLATVLDVDSAEREDAAERGQARALLARVAEQIPATADGQIETRVLAGSPAQALLELAADEHVDLIAVGRRGRGLSRALIGSAAQQISASSRIPVLLATPADRKTG